MGAPDTVTVRTDEAIPPTGGVTGFVSKTRLNPLGAPDVARVTGAENLPIDCTSIVEVPDPPGPRDMDDGFAVTVKSAAPAVISICRSAV